MSRYVPQKTTLFPRRFPISEFSFSVISRCVIILNIRVMRIGGHIRLLYVLYTRRSKSSRRISSKNGYERSQSYEGGVWAPSDSKLTAPTQPIWLNDVGKTYFNPLDENDEICSCNFIMFALMNALCVLTYVYKRNRRILRINRRTREQRNT